VTAQMERLLDQVLVGQQELVGAIDAVCAQASRIIGRLQEGAGCIDTALLSGAAKEAGADRPPTPAMKRYVDSLARQKRIKPPRGYTTSSRACRIFLDQHAARKDGQPATADADAGETASVREADTNRPAVQREDAGAPASRADEAQSGRFTKSRHRMAELQPKPGSEGARRKRSGKAAEAAEGVDAAGADTPLRIPFGNKEAALKLGARYRAGGWYAPPGTDLAGFRKRGWI
jgi:DNA topoisomerase III